MADMPQVGQGKVLPPLNSMTMSTRFSVSEKRASVISQGAARPRVAERRDMVVVTGVSFGRCLNVAICVLIIKSFRRPGMDAGIKTDSRSSHLHKRCHRKKIAQLPVLSSFFYVQGIERADRHICRRLGCPGAFSPAAAALSRRLYTENCCLIFHTPCSCATKRTFETYGALNDR